MPNMSAFSGRAPGGGGRGMSESTNYYRNAAALGRTMSERAGYRPNCRICGDHYADMPHCYEPEQDFEQYAEERFASINRALDAHNRTEESNGKLFESVLEDLRYARTRDIQLFVCVVIVAIIAIAGWIR